MNTTLEKFNSIFTPRKKHYKVLDRFDLSKYKNKKQLQLQLSKELLLHPKTTEFLKNYSKHDLFEILKVKVNENQISDAIAFCLNPKKSVWGKEILLKLISENTDNTEIFDIITKTPSNKFYVKRDWAGQFSRIDIRVMTKNGINSPNIIIDFEMKVGSGEETFSEGKYQTQREWEDLLRLAESLNIPKKHIIAFYVSPLGLTAHSETFINIRYSYFNNLIKKILLSPNETNDHEYKYAFIHFLASKHIFQE